MKHPLAQRGPSLPERRRSRAPQDRKAEPQDRDAESQKQNAQQLGLYTISKHVAPRPRPKPATNSDPFAEFSRQTSTDTDPFTEFSRQTSTNMQSTEDMATMSQEPQFVSRSRFLSASSARRSFRKETRQPTRPWGHHLAILKIILKRKRRNQPSRRTP
jgi:hypothetical protein